MNGENFVNFLADILVMNQTLYITKGDTKYVFKGWNEKSLIFKTGNTKMYIDKDILAAAYNERVNSHINKKWVKNNFHKEFDHEIHILKKIITLAEYLYD